MPNDDLPASSLDPDFFRDYSGTMARHWNRTTYPGVRFREHPSRKHNGKADRYFSIRYYVNYKDCEEGLGWASDGWNAEKAHKVLAKIKEGVTTGIGAQSLGDLRAEAEARRAKETNEAKLSKVQSMTLSTFLAEYYLPEAERTKRTWKDDKGRIERHINAKLGSFPLSAITKEDVKSFLDFLRKEGLSEATALHHMAILRRAFNMARTVVIEGVPLFAGLSPLDGVPLPKPKNARERFLNYEEADKLLEAAQKSGHADLHTAIVIALNTGMRLGEILRLEWIDVDMAHGIITVREEADRKPGGKVFINTEVEAVLKKRISSRRHSRLVLAPPKGGKERSSLTHRFSDLVEELGFNAGIEDARHKVVFHTLRHTFASWLALAGTDIYRIKTLMRHKTITMTMRYAHLIPDATRSAVHNLRPANGATRF